MRRSANVEITSARGSCDVDPTSYNMNLAGTCTSILIILPPLVSMESTGTGTVIKRKGVCQKVLILENWTRAKRGELQTTMRL